jgi:hypothetical protein
LSTTEKQVSTFWKTRHFSFLNSTNNDDFFAVATRSGANAARAVIDAIHSTNNTINFNNHIVVAFAIAFASFPTDTAIFFYAP